jgi:hypothetical protein
MPFRDDKESFQMECRIDHLVVVAGPTASGKSTLISELCKKRFPEIENRLGIENLAEWPRVSAISIDQLIEPALEGLILHYDFLYDGDEALGLLDGVHQVSFITLWTPPERLRSQLITGKLRRRGTGNLFELVKSNVFQLLPLTLILRMSKIPLWLLPRSLLRFHLNALKIYSQPPHVAHIYRRWLRFCNKQIAKTKSHIILELDDELRSYSLEEWKSMIHQSYSLNRQREMS